MGAAVAVTGADGVGWVQGWRHMRAPLAPAVEPLRGPCASVGGRGGTGGGSGRCWPVWAGVVGMSCVPFVGLGLILRADRTGS